MLTPNEQKRCIMLCAGVAARIVHDGFNHPHSKKIKELAEASFDTFSHAMGTNECTLAEAVFIANYIADAAFYGAVEQSNGHAAGCQCDTSTDEHNPDDSTDGPLPKPRFNT